MHKSSYNVFNDNNLPSYDNEGNIWEYMEG